MSPRARTAARAAFAPTRWITATALAALSIAVAAAALQFLRADLRAKVYEQRLETLATEFTSLQSAYNRAVARTAVTELVVSEDNTLSVRVRDASGAQSLTPTPFDPTGEIYIDYVIADSRLLVRRLFDERTAPSDALLLDETLGAIGWEDSPEQQGVGPVYGKAVYRTLTPGRWVVTVSGDGSLGLKKLDAARGSDVELVYAPAIGQFDQWLAEAHDDADRITFRQAIAALFAP